MMRTVALALVFIPLLTGGGAWAGWTRPGTGTFSGSPKDLVSAGPGSAALATSTAAHEISFGTTVGPPLSSASLASGWLGSGCLAAMDSAGNVGVAPPCALSPPAALLQSAIQVRALSSGAAFACSRDDGMASSITSKDGVAFTPDWTATAWTRLLGALQVPGKCTHAMSVLGLGTQAYALLAYDDLTTSGARNLMLLRDGAILWTGGTLPSGNLAPPSVSLAGYSNGPLRAFAVEATTGELAIAELDGGFGPFTRVPPPAGSSRFRSVSVYQSGTERFGMALADLPDGGTIVLSAVPFPDPLAFGSQWRESTNPPTGLSGDLRMIDCSSASACAAATNGTGLNSMATYVNASAPSSVGGPPVSVPEGSSVSATASATDPDGDAVHVAWSAPDGGWSVQPGDAGTVALITAPVLGGICDGGAQFAFALVASDGMAGHETQGSVQVTLTRNSAPLTPGVNPPQLLLQAGGAPGSAQAVRNPSECVDFPFSWSGTSAWGVQLSGAADGTVTVTPPPHLCVPGGITESFEVVAQSAYGDSDAGALTVHVDPWGPPEPPFPAGELRFQDAGTTVAYVPAATHVCDDGGLQVPLTTRWALDGGALLSGVVLAPDLSMPGGATAAELKVMSADRCASGEISLSARNEVTTTGEVSAWAPLTIAVTAELDPVDGAKLELVSDGGSLSGDARVSGINCVKDRGLQADFFLETAGLPTVQQSFPVPGPWALTPPASCESRTFTVHAELPGIPSSRSNEVTWTREGSEPSLGALDGGVFFASCEPVDGAARVVATGTLHHQPSASSCAEEQIEWTQTSGPALTSPVVTGGDATATARAASWDALIDQELSFEVVARAGSKVSAPSMARARVIPSAAFVNARLDANPPIASDTGIVALVARLHNDSGCPVENARWTFFLDGLLPQAQRARVAGELKPVRTEGATVTVEGVSIAPYGEATVTFSARPALLGRPTARGVLSLGDPASPEPISNEARLGQSVPVTGCGCGAGGLGGAGGSVGAGILALALLAMRRALNPRGRHP